MPMKSTREPGVMMTFLAPLALHEKLFTVTAALRMTKKSFMIGALERELDRVTKLAKSPGRAT